MTQWGAIKGCQSIFWNVLAWTVSHRRSLLATIIFIFEGSMSPCLWILPHVNSQFLSPPRRPWFSLFKSLFNHSCCVQLLLRSIFFFILCSLLYLMNYIPQSHFLSPVTFLAISTPMHIYPVSFLTIFICISPLFQLHSKFYPLSFYFHFIWIPSPLHLHFIWIP